MDRQTLLSMFTGAMRHRLQYGANKWGAETWQDLHPRRCIKHVIIRANRLFDAMTNDPLSRNNVVDLANYAAFAWAIIQGLPNKDISLPARPVPPLSLRDTQARLAEWQAGNRLAATPELLVLGVMEELGELAHCLLKRAQGIRGYDNPDKFRAESRDAIGDCLIYLTQVAHALGYDLQDVLDETAAQVLKRDWINHPEDADKVCVGDK